MHGLCSGKWSEFIRFIEGSNSTSGSVRSCHGVTPGSIPVCCLYAWRGLQRFFFLAIQHWRLCISCGLHHQVNGGDVCMTDLEWDVKEPLRMTIKLPGSDHCQCPHIQHTIYTKPAHYTTDNTSAAPCIACCSLKQLQITPHYLRTWVMFWQGWFFMTNCYLARAACCMSQVNNFLSVSGDRSAKTPMLAMLVVLNFTNVNCGDLRLFSLISEDLRWSEVIWGDPKWCQAI